MKLSKETLQVLKDRGYKNLNEYLENLADSTGVDLEIVYMTADLLGENELFDGLVSMIEDM